MSEEQPPTCLESSLVKIASYVNVADADFARMYLGLNGIRARLGNQNFALWFWHYSNATGGVRLLVMAEDVEKSRELLGSRVAESMVNRPPCEHCGEPLYGSWDLCWRCASIDDRAEGAGAATAEEALHPTAERSDAEGMVVIASVVLFALTGGSVMVMCSCLLTLLAVVSLGSDRREQADHSGEDESVGGLSEAVLTPSERSQHQHRRIAGEVARRAWQSSFFGLLMFPPLTFYSLYLLLRLMPHRHTMCLRDRWKFRCTVPVALLGLGLISILLAAMVGVLGIADILHDEWIYSASKWFEAFCVEPRY